MKKVVLLLLSLIVSFSAMAQADADRQAVTNAGVYHQTFKGIPIDGTQDAFVRKLEAKGFKREKRVENCIYLSGRFAGYNNCQIFVDRNTYVNLVNSVGVTFPPAENWAQLEKIYTSLQQMLTKKYGNPSADIKEFVPFTPATDDSKFTAVQNNQCKYATTYDNGKKGSVTLSITTGEKNACFITMRYVDTQNFKVGQEGAIDDL